ncbi:glycosyltransferase [Leptolyngbya sp. AN02str]|uniref:glycosyltransferase n=1 Tax=Leptolyngbya sp. AN02str TaxID=3423363 RepID=UPI003D322E9D
MQSHDLRIKGLESNSIDENKLVIVIPSFNDWEALEKLLTLIDEAAMPQVRHLEVLIVDDFSSKPIPESLIEQNYFQIQKVNILRLRRNLGHQRAIVIGLSYVYHNLDCKWVVVMDGDGEDNPFEIERLLEAAETKGNSQIVFAKRSKRSESRGFRVSYFIYKRLYRLLVGREISVGNFSLLPFSLLRHVVVVSEIWNHYSCGLHRSRIPYMEINVPRARRLAGKPKMNMVSLVTHGLSSIAVYGDIVGTRILMSTAALLAFLLMVLGVVILIRLFTDWGVPGWATYVSGLLILALFQLVLLGTVFSMIILSARNNSNFIPTREYKYYVDRFFSLKSTPVAIHS